MSNVGKFTVTLKSDLIQIKIEEVNKIGNYYFRNLRFYNIYFFFVYKKSFLQPYGDIGQVFENFELFRCQFSTLI